MNLGISIKTIRKNSGLKQYKFAKELGITQPYLSQIENNYKKPSYEVIENIAKITNTPLPILFWFGVTEKDVRKDKLRVFMMLKPTIDKLIRIIFSLNK